MQILGICRFSYLGEGGFQRTHQTLEERAAYLFDEARMATRFCLFETICLPTIKAQTDPDFTLILVISTEMPAAQVARLRALVADVPQIRVEAHPPGPHRTAMHDVIEAHVEKSGPPCLQFRLDDDDGVSIDFIRLLRRAAQDARPLLRRYPHVAIDFNRGWVIAPGTGAVRIAPVQIAYWGLAFGLLKRPAARLSIHSVGHHKLWKRVPTLTFPDHDMMLRGFHEDNDSHQGHGRKTYDFAPVTDEQAARFREAYNVDVDEIAARFSAL